MTELFTVFDHRKDAITTVFEYWKFILGHERAKLDVRRAQAIRHMLRYFSVDDLQLAIEGCAASAWHQGENDRHVKFDSITLIFRDADHCEKFMEMGEQARKIMEKLNQKRAEQKLIEPLRAPTQEEKTRVRDMLKDVVKLRRIA